MKIAIITFHRALNYGAVLQAFALQKKLEDMGHKAVILDHNNKKIASINSVLRIGDNKNIIHIIKELVNAPFRLIRKRKFEDFVSGKLKIYPIEEYTLSDINDNFDIFITGSDQVWNPYLTDHDDAYFLDFVNLPEKKVSYAASIGIKCFSDDDRIKVGKMLQSFAKISVREQSAKDLLQNIVNIPIKVVVDPTLLVDRTVYADWIEKDNKGKYIFVYSLNSEVNLMTSVFELAEKENLKILYICNELYDIKKHINKRIHHVLNPSPERFISLLANAEYVATNSFHGTVFSIIFHKQFLCETDYGKSKNGRVIDLLRECGLSERIVGDYALWQKNIEWCEVDRKLKCLQSSSVAYIKELTGMPDCEEEDERTN